MLMPPVTVNHQAQVSEHRSPHIPVMVQEAGEIVAFKTSGKHAPVSMLLCAYWAFNNCLSRRAANIWSIFMGLLFFFLLIYRHLYTSWKPGFYK